MKRLIVIVLMVLTVQMTFGQSKSESINSIKIIRSYINEVEADEYLVEGIEEGEIEYNGKKGGFETYNLIDKDTKQLYRIRHNEVTSTALSLTFYYMKDKLIYAKAEKGCWENSKYIKEYTQEVFFKRGKIIKEIGVGMNAYKLKDIGMGYCNNNAKRLNK